MERAFHREVFARKQMFRVSLRGISCDDTSSNQGLPINSKRKDIRGGHIQHSRTIRAFACPSTSLLWSDQRKIDRLKGQRVCASFGNFVLKLSCNSTDCMFVKIHCVIADRVPLVTPYIVFYEVFKPPIHKAIPPKIK